MKSIRGHKVTIYQGTCLLFEQIFLFTPSLNAVKEVVSLTKDTFSKGNTDLRSTEQGNKLEIALKYLYCLPPSNVKSGNYSYSETIGPNCHCLECKSISIWME